MDVYTHILFLAPGPQMCLAVFSLPASLWYPKGAWIPYLTTRASIYEHSVFPYMLAGFKNRLCSDTLEIYFYSFSSILRSFLQFFNSFLQFFWISSTILFNSSEFLLQFFSILLNFHFFNSFQFFWISSTILFNSSEFLLQFFSILLNFFYNSFHFFNSFQFFWISSTILLQFSSILFHFFYMSFHLLSFPYNSFKILIPFNDWYFTSSTILLKFFSFWESNS